MANFDDMIWEAQQTLNETAKDLPLETQKRLGLESAYNTKSRNIRNELPLMQGQSMTDGYSEFNGNPVSNRDAIYNDMSGAEMQQLLSHASNQSIRRDEEGKPYNFDEQGNKVYLDPNVKGEFLYGGYNEEGDNFKLGKSAYGVEERYNPFLAYMRGKTNNKKYGWEAGEDGIDSRNPAFNWELPGGLASQIESIHKGNKPSLGSREVFDDGSPEAIARRQELGGGASEYFDSGTTPLLNAKTENINKARRFDELLAGAGGTQEAGGTGNMFLDRGNSSGGRQWNNLKGAGAILGNMGQNILDYSAEGYGKLGNQMGLLTKEQAEDVGSYLDTTPEQWEKKLGVNTKWRDSANRELENAVKDGRYMDAIGSVASNLDVHLAQSLPEMGALALKIPGMITAVGSRVQEQKRAFAETNGREPTEKEELGMWATNAGVLGVEKLLLVGPLKNIFKAALGGKAGKTVLDTTGKNLRSKAGKVGITAAGEVAQEITDQAQENYWKKGGSQEAPGLEAFTAAYDKLKAGEVLSKDEAIMAGIAGGVMGGAIRGAVEAPGIPAAAKRDWDIRNVKKSLNDMDTYLDAEDKKFVTMDIESTNEDIQAERDTILEAKKELRAARLSDNNTIDELSKSENPKIKEFMTEMKSEYIDKMAGTLDPKDKNVQNAIITKAIDDDTVLEPLGIDKEAFSKGSFAEKRELITKALENRDTREKAIAGLTTEDKNFIFDAVVSKEDKDKFDEDGAGQYKQKLTGEAKQKQAKIDVNTAGNKRATKTPGKPKISGKVDLKGEKVNYEPKLGNLFRTLFKSRGDKKRARAEINKYDNASLREALNTATDQESVLIQEVLDKRAEAKEKAGIDKSTKATIGLEPTVKKNQELAATPKETKNSILAMARNAELNSLQDVENFKDFVNRAEEAGHLTKKQADVVRSRIQKIEAKTKDNELADIETAKKSTDAYKKAIEKGDKQPKTTDGKERLYKFEDKSGKTYEGVIVHDNKNDGTVHVEATIDGKKEVLIFGANAGFQVSEVDKPRKYTKGREYDKNTEDTQEAEEDTEENVDFEETSETSLDATEKANNAIFGFDFNPEDATAEEIKKAREQLKRIYDC